MEEIQGKILDRFKDLQDETARQVLNRCFKRVTKVDAATMMGKDMFAQERLDLNNTISALKVECHEKQDIIERGVKY